MKPLPAAILAVSAVLAGCAATATQNWRTGPEPDAPLWTITGRQGALGQTAISINERPVLEGRVSVLTGNGEMDGHYDGKTVAADCKKGRSGGVRTQCALTVDGRKATTLYFRID